MTLGKRVVHSLKPVIRTTRFFIIQITRPWGRIPSSPLVNWYVQEEIILLIIDTLTPSINRWEENSLILLTTGLFSAEYPPIVAQHLIPCYPILFGVRWQDNYKIRFIIISSSSSTRACYLPTYLGCHNKSIDFFRGPTTTNQCSVVWRD